MGKYDYKNKLFFLKEGHITEVILGSYYDIFLFLNSYMLLNEISFRMHFNSS